MASAELRRLHKLHLIDSALLEIRKRAAGLNAGAKTGVEIQELQKQLENAPAKKLQAEQTDLELQQKGIDDKLKKYDKELYGGKVVNPREVEAIEKEIASLKRHRSELDGRILEIWDELPPAKAQLEKIEKGIADRKALLARQQKEALETKAKLEAEFKARTAERPAAAKEVPPSLLARYEAIRQKHAGVGMGDVVKRTCGACGTSLPERTMEALKDDKVVTCEACHRLLYYTEGVV